MNRTTDTGIIAHARADRRIICTLDADFRAALNEIESLITAKAETPEGNRLEVLVTLLETYERVHFPMDLPKS